MGRSIPKLYVMAINGPLRLFDSLEIIGALDDLFRVLLLTLVDKIEAVGRHEHRSGCDIGGSTNLSVTDT
jgi:hypothetical protein